MPISYTIDLLLGIVFRECNGPIVLKELEDHWRELLLDPKLPAEDPLVIFTDLQLCEINLNGEKLLNLIDTVITPIFGTRQWISAVVVSTGVDFGTSRQFSTYSEHL